MTKSNQTYLVFHVENKTFQLGCFDQDCRHSHVRVGLVLPRALSGSQLTDVIDILRSGVVDQTLRDNRELEATPMDVADPVDTPAVATPVAPRQTSNRVFTQPPSGGRRPPERSQSEPVLVMPRPVSRKRSNSVVYADPLGSVFAAFNRRFESCAVLKRPRI